MPKTMKKLTVLEMNRLSVSEFKQAAKMPLALVLDDVRSMYNVGSVFRTADAYRVERICLCGITACPPHPEIHKTALGAEDSVDWQHFDTALQAVDSLREQGYEVLALEQCEGSIPLQTFFQQPRAAQKFALVLGNEVKGVQQAVVDQCDACIELPQFGTKHSLNVSCAASIAIWEFARNLII